VPDFADIFIENLAQSLSVGIFDYGNRDEHIYVRPANIIATHINLLEKEAEFDHIMPYTLELWRLDFMLQTDDFESETLRWGTFSPDAEGWLGHHTGWNEARTVLVFSRDDNELSLLGHIDWWMEETPLGLEGALYEFLEREGIFSAQLHSHDDEETSILRGAVLEFEPFHSDGRDGNIVFWDFLKVEGINLHHADRRFRIRRFEDIPILDAQGNPISEYDIEVGSIVDIWHVGRMTLSLPPIARAIKVRVVPTPETLDLIAFHAEVLEFDPAYYLRNQDALLFVRSLSQVGNHSVVGRYFLQGENVSVRDSQGNAISVSDIQSGTTAFVRASGLVFESDPAIIPGTMSIQVVDAIDTTQMTIHTVVAGETLAGIASQHGTDINSIIEANNLSDGLFLQIGQELIIPAIHGWALLEPGLQPHLVAIPGYLTPGGGIIEAEMREWEPLDIAVSENIYIREIASGEAIPVARLVLGENNIYTIVVTVDDGDDRWIFSGLRDYFTERTTQSGSWRYFSTNSSRDTDSPHFQQIPFANFPWDIEVTEGVYYLYVGSSNELLTGVHVEIIGRGTSAAIDVLA
jgi:LysM repeat protein